MHSQVYAPQVKGQNYFTGTWSSTQEEEDGDASQIDKKPSILQTLLRGKQQVL